MSETTDPVTEQMRQETGHDCITCPTAVRNLMATAHNALSAWDGGTANLVRTARKMESLREALAKVEPIAAEHFEALKAWRRP